MSRQTATDKALAKIDAEIATLQALRARLIDVIDAPETKKRKPRAAKTMPAGEARPIA